MGCKIDGGNILFVDGLNDGGLGSGSLLVELSSSSPRTTPALSGALGPGRCTTECRWLSVFLLLAQV